MEGFGADFGFDSTDDLLAGGPVGLLTVFLKTQIGIDLRLLGFNILSFWGRT